MPDFVAVSIGNSRARVGAFTGQDLHDPVALPVSQLDEIARHALDRAESSAPIILASVNEPAAGPLEERLLAGAKVARIGRDIPIPLRTSVDEPQRLGQDRALNAVAAFARARQACVVIDAGTCITVDFVDGEGVLHGGAIAPGLSTMLRAMHERTAALPSLEPALPSLETPFGRSTRDAMLIGARAAAQGLAHLLIDRYADYYQAYPVILATGGDAPTLFESDELVEHIVPDLVLAGIHAAVRAFEADE